MCCLLRNAFSFDCGLRLAAFTTTNDSLGVQSFWLWRKSLVRQRLSFANDDPCVNSRGRDFLWRDYSGRSDSGGWGCLRYATAAATNHRFSCRVGGCLFPQHCRSSEAVRLAPPTARYRRSKPYRFRGLWPLFAATLGAKQQRRGLS